MFIELINFRCFGKLKLQIPDNGVILLHGGSGIGKTTIFKAINFALFGKEQKIVKYNEKKCTVKLKFKDITITRTKTPNHLTVDLNNEHYEDDAAQEIIFKKYGKYFNITSYVAQKSIESFANLPVSDKMEFFNNLSLKDFDIKSLKDKTKDIIKDRKKLVNDKTNEIRVLNNELTSFNLPDKIDLPYFLNEDTLEYDIHEHKNKKDSLYSNLDKLKKNLNSKKIQFKQLYQNKNLLIELNSNLNSISKEILSLQEVKTQLNNDLSEDNTPFIHNLKLISNYIKLHLELSNLKTQLEESKNQIINKENKNLTKITDKLNSSFITKDNINTINLVIKYKPQFDLIFQLFPNINIQDNLNNLLKDNLIIMEKEYGSIELEIRDLEKINFEIENDIKNYNKTLNCPKCKISLVIKNGSIESCDEKSLLNNTNHSTDLTKLKEYLKQNKLKIEKLSNTKNLLTERLYKIKQINKEHSTPIQEDTFTFYLKNKSECSDINKLTSSFKEFESLLNEEKNIKQKIDNVDENELVKSLLTKINNHEKEIKIIKNNCEKELNEQFITQLLKFDNFSELEDIQKWNDFLEYDENEIIDMLEDLLVNLIKKENQRDLMLKRIKETDNKLLSLNKSLITIQNEIDKIDISIYDELEKEIENIDLDIKEKEKEREELIDRDKEIIIYMSYKSEIDRFQALKDKIEKCQLDEKGLIKSLNVSENFLKIVGNAEALSVSNTLSNINNLIKYYITHFFPNGDFDMKLTPYKETSKGDKKSGLDIEIITNGEKIGIDNLSGGEFDRCLLILFLAFNNVVNSDIIMLDECLSSLNSELVEEIVDVLKNSLKDKLVLLTLHQANTGIFDYIIDVEKLR